MTTTYHACCTIDMGQMPIVNRHLSLTTVRFKWSYSYLMASMGSNLAAFFAGYHPKNTPVKVQTAKLIAMLQGSMTIDM